MHDKGKPTGLHALQEKPIRFHALAISKLKIIKMVSMPPNQSTTHGLQGNKNWTNHNGDKGNNSGFLHDKGSQSDFMQLPFNQLPICVMADQERKQNQSDSANQIQLRDSALDSAKGNPNRPRTCQFSPHTWGCLPKHKTYGLASQLRFTTPQTAHKYRIVKRQNLDSSQWFPPLKTTPSFGRTRIHKARQLLLFPIFFFNSKQHSKKP